MRVVFAHPRYDYPSYVDYRRLVELGGFEVCRFDEIDLAEGDTIFIASPPNRALHDRLSRFHGGSIRAKVVVWNLERPDVRTVNIRDLLGNEVHASTETLASLPGVAAIWVSDRHLATLDARYSFVPLGSDARLAEGRHMAPSWDLCHLSRVRGRRSVIEQLGTRLRVAPEASGAERARILRTSRAILNVHQTPYPIGAPLRFALAAAFGLPLISETIRDPHPLVAGTTFIEVDYERLLDEVPVWLTDPERRARLVQSGRNLQRLLTVDMTFESMVREAVAGLG